MIIDDSHDEGDMMTDENGKPKLIRRKYFPNIDNNAYLKHDWDLNNYGPIYLPKRGETITLTTQNLKIGC